MWRQKRKSIHELKWSAGLSIEADESVLMCEEWKGRRSEKHKCCIYSRFPIPTFSQLGNLRSRQRMTLRTIQAKHFTTHTSPLSLFAFIIWLAPRFPTFIIIWRPPTTLIWYVVSETLHFLTVKVSPPYIIMFTSMLELFTSETLSKDLLGAVDEINVEENVAFDLVTERASFANLLNPSKYNLLIIFVQNMVRWSEIIKPSKESYFLVQIKFTSTQ